MVVLAVLACGSLHVCAVCIWRCEHVRFCVNVYSYSVPGECRRCVKGVVYFVYVLCKMCDIVCAGVCDGCDKLYAGAV